MFYFHMKGEEKTIVEESVPAGKFRIRERTGTKHPSVSPRVKIRTIPVCFCHSGPFRKIPAGIQVSAGMNV